MWEQFVELVGRHFRFLEAEFGFTQKSTNPPFVIYDSDNLRVLVFFDVDRRHELDLGIRRVKDQPRTVPSVGIGMLMRLKDGPDSAAYQSPFPSTEADLECEVKRLAELLRKYGSAILKGDLSDLDRIEQEEKELAKKFGRQSIRE